MPLPTGFAMLALSPTIREDAAFLFLQTGINGMIDMFIQSATGTAVNIMQINTGVLVANTVYVNELGNDNTGRRGDLTRPFATIEAAANVAQWGDTVEVFPGTYPVTGNMFRSQVNFNFHKNSAVSLTNSGRLHTPALEGVNIYGHLNLSTDGGTVEPFPVKILGSPNYIEFDNIYCAAKDISISGSDAQVTFIGATKLATISCRDVILDRSYTNFENASITPLGSIYSTRNSGGYSYTSFKDCELTSNYYIDNPCAYAFSGKTTIDNTTIRGGYVRIITEPNEYSEIRNSKFECGVVVSGSNYFDRTVFHTTNQNRYPNFAIISNMGGHSTFTDCYARNFENAGYINYTMFKSGTLSGASNFNIGNAFTSFKPNFSGVTVNYGSFVYNTGVK